MFARSTALSEGDAQSRQKVLQGDVRGVIPRCEGGEGVGSRHVEQMRAFVERAQRQADRTERQATYAQQALARYSRRRKNQKTSEQAAVRRRRERDGQATRRRARQARACARLYCWRAEAGAYNSTRGANVALPRRSSARRAAPSKRAHSAFASARARYAAGSASARW